MKLLRKASGMLPSRIHILHVVKLQNVGPVSQEMHFFIKMHAGWFPSFLLFRQPRNRSLAILQPT
jgi:hypothetical protein